MTAPDPDAWLRRARALLDESTQSLDAATLSRLNRARQAALEPRRPRAGWAWSGLAAVGAGALALAIAVGLQRLPGEPASAPDADAPARAAASEDGDDDLLAAEDLEFLEDLDFYQWLDREGRSAPPPESESAPRRPL